MQITSLAILAASVHAGLIAVHGGHSGIGLGGGYGGGGYGESGLEGGHGGLEGGHLIAIAPVAVKETVVDYHVSYHNFSNTDLLTLNL